MTLGKSIIFGNTDASYAPAKRIDYNGFLQVLHTGFLVSASALITFLITAVMSIDIVPNSSMDETIITLIIIPLLKFALVYFKDNQ